MKTALAVAFALVATSAFAAPAGYDRPGGYHDQVKAGSLSRLFHRRTGYWFGRNSADRNMDEPHRHYDWQRHPGAISKDRVK